MSDEAYLEIEPIVFESVKSQALKDFEANCPSEGDDKYQFPDLEFDCCEDEYKDGFLTLGGDLKLPKSSKKLGYISIKIKMDQDRTIEVVSDYMKRLGKLKTVLEATK